MTSRQRKQAEAAAKREKLAKIMKEAGGAAELDLSKVTTIDGDDKAKLAEIRKLNEELADLETQVTQLAEIEKAAKQAELDEAERKERKEGDHPGNGPKGPRKTFAQLVLESGILKSAHGNEATHTRKLPDADPRELMQQRKATVTGGTYAEDGSSAAGSYLPELMREGEIVPFGFQEPMVVDAIPMRTTAQRAVEYMEQTTRGGEGANPAGQPDARAREEGALYPATVFEWTVRTQPVENIGVYVPVTDEILEDVPMMEGILNDDLSTEVRRYLSSQLLNGNGNSPNLRGILNKAGINTHARGADRNLDAFAVAIRHVEVNGFAMVDRIFIHPDDWWEIRTMKTNNGDYLFGRPDGPGFNLIWGKPRVITQEIAQGTAVVGDSMYARHYSRRGITVEIGMQSDDFVKGLKTIRARCRDAMVVTRALAWARLTDLQGIAA